MSVTKHACHGQRCNYPTAENVIRAASFHHRILNRNIVGEIQLNFLFSLKKKKKEQKAHKSFSCKQHVHSYHADFMKQQQFSFSHWLQDTLDVHFLVFLHVLVHLQSSYTCSCINCIHIEMFFFIQKSSIKRNWSD